MPATFDANGFTILNTITQDQWYQRFQEIRNRDQSYGRSTYGTAMVAIAELRAEGWNGPFLHLDLGGSSLEEWGIAYSALCSDTSISVAPSGEPGKPDITNETFCFCDSCKQKRYETNGLKRRVVHNYSYAPRAWRMHKTTDDKFPYYMGVELETTAYHRDHLDNRFAADMKRPKQFWLAKRDGSVTGPEFASHPATLTWWHDNEGNLRDMFKMLTHAGFTSHNGAQAGMHINISRDAFSSPEHLHRFLTLLTIRPDWSIQMAQRSTECANRWARIIQYNEATARAAFTGQTRWLTDKYSIVNILRNRYEFRLPRGTLRMDRFFKNLEWAAGMIGFTRSVEDMAAYPSRSVHVLGTEFPARVC